MMMWIFISNTKIHYSFIVLIFIIIHADLKNKIFELML